MRRFGVWGGVAALIVAVLGAGQLWSIHSELQSVFRGQLFAIPARVYSRPLELVKGVDLDSGAFERLRKLGYVRVRGPEVRPGEYVLEGRRLVYSPRQRSPQDEEEALEGSQTIVIDTDRSQRIRRIATASGQTLSAVSLAPELISELYGLKRERRRLIGLDDVPECLLHAILTIEDQRFYQHQGLDLWRIFGAAFANMKAGRVVQGGSTITQQLVKNVMLSPERALSRKVREAFMALLLELTHTKDEILTAYLNEIYLGQRGSIAIHGFGAAARHYFAKDIASVTLAEAALLAGMIRAPARYSPYQHPNAALERRNRVLEILLEAEQISPEEAEEAMAAPLEVGAIPEERRFAPHFIAGLRSTLAETYGEAALEREGLAIISTLDPVAQQAARDAVRRGVERLERDYPHLHDADSPLEAALIALDPSSGDVLAHIGGRDFARSQFDRATQARRQPGSVFKPIVALAALSRTEDGQPPLTLAHHLEDAELRVETREGPWIPANFDGQFHGTVTLRDSIERSLNVPIARLGLEVGPERIVETARRLGIESPLARVPSLALGASELTLLEITRAYAVLAANGLLPEPRRYTEVRDAEAETLERVGAVAEEVFDPAETYLVTSALQGVIDRGTGRGVRGFGIHGPIAGKTGTTNGFRDAWFVGYTPSLVVGVWVGFDEGRGVGVPASVAALPIFADFVKRTLGTELDDPFPRPPGIDVVSINRESGLRAGLGCSGEKEIFLAGSAPDKRCIGTPFEVIQSPLRWLTDRLRGDMEN